VEVIDVVADDETVEDAVVVTVVVDGRVVTVDVSVEVIELVSVVVSVVKSHFVYEPDCHNPIALFNAFAVTAHFANGEPPVESFKKPSGVH
jgi:hypothetical protein